MTLGTHDTVTRNSDIYIEDWSGLTSTLDAIVNGDNNSLESINSIKNAVITARDKSDRQDFVDDAIFVGGLTAVGTFAIKGGVAYVAGKAVTGKAVTSAPVGFSTFNQLKEYLGSAGKGNHWHHIVEQCQIAKSGFSETIIHATNNIYAVNTEVHAKITGYYGSIQKFTNGMRVRDWLAGKSFEEQYEFGYNILKMYGVVE